VSHPIAVGQLAAVDSRDPDEPSTDVDSEPSLAEEATGDELEPLEDDVPVEEPRGFALLDPEWPKNVRPMHPEAPTMTDDWFGLGPALRDLGFNLKYFWNSHYYSVMKGGGRTSGGRHSATYDWLITLDFERMGVIENGEMLVHARQQFSDSVNRITGSTQQVNDDADGDRSLYVDQLWYRHHFLNDRVSLQVGYLDFQTIVDRNVYANSEDKQFMNAMLDNNPLFPTASAAGLGMTLYLRPCDWYELILGVADAQRLPLYKPGFSTTFHDEAWFLGYMEHNLKIELPSDNGPLPGNYRFGAMYDPNPRDFFVRPGRRAESTGNRGAFYLSFDQMLFRERPEDEQGLGWFCRYGYTRDDVRSDAGFYNQFWSTGFAYTGLVPGRDGDTLGLAIAQLVPSDQYRRRIDDTVNKETAYELYYAIQVTPWLVIAPDIQYIDNPGGLDNDGLPSHTIAGGLRMRITF
jgi:porin